MELSSISVIIPAYNEEKRIRTTLEDLLHNMRYLKEIIVVCDGVDGTAELARSFGDKIKVLEFKDRLGKGGAIIEGFKEATGQVISFVDADGAISWDEVERLSLKVSKQVPCVIGSRWSYDSDITRNQPKVRMLLGKAYRTMTKILLGITVDDVQCGLKCFEKSLAKDLVPKIFLRDWSFDTSLIYNVHLMGKTIREEGIKWADVSDSKVKLLKVVPMMFAYVIGLKAAHSRFTSGFNLAFQKISVIFSSA